MGENEQTRKYQVKKVRRSELRYGTRMNEDGFE
jgi:hypothetical protein